MGPTDRIGTKTMRELTPADFNVYRDERLMEVKARSVQRKLSPVQNFFEVARTDWGLPSKENLVSKVKFALTSNRCERLLMAGGFEVLLAAAKMTQNPFVLPMVLRALQTALRRSELLAIDWEGRVRRQALRAC